MRPKLSAVLRSRHRRGFTLTEMTVAMALFTAATLAVAQLAILTKQSYRQMWEQQVVGEALANLAEEIQTFPFEELQHDVLEKLQLPGDVQEQLPTAKLSVTLTDLPVELPGKRVLLEVTRGEHAPREKLAVWRFAPEETP